MADPPPAARNRSQSVPLAPLLDWGSLKARLPTPLSSFVGREREVVVATELLRRDDVRLLTLTGPGGVGKTRLGIHAASLLADEFAHHVRFVGLDALDDPRLVLPAVAEAMELPELGDDPSPERLAAAFGTSRFLLMLDNLEQVGAAAPAVAALLGACPALTVLATSRSPLRLTGEHEFPVRPLPLPDLDRQLGVDDLVRYAAVELFLQRAIAVRPDFVLSANNAAAVAQVCVRLDGLPLAIELAAARTKVLSPQAVLARLEHRFSFLTGGALDLPPRLRTLHDAVAWSHDLLSAAERALFRRLAVFVGGFTLAEADAVAASAGHTDRDLLDTVTALVDKSLMTRREETSGELRLGMLESVREFGLELLAASGEEAETRERHAAYFLALAERFADWPAAADAEAEFDRLATAHGNLRAALAWLDRTGDTERALRLAAALARFWYARSHRAEGHRWLDRLLVKGGAAAPAVRAAALLGLGVLASGPRSDERAVPPLQESLALWRSLGDARGTAETLLMLGIKLENLGAYGEAVPLVEEAETLFDGLGLEAWAAAAHHHRGVLAYGQCDHSRAAALLENAVSRHRACGETGAPLGWLASALNDLGVVVGEGGDLARAGVLHAESLDRWRRAGTFEGVADALANLGTVAAAFGWQDRAARLFGAATRLAEALGYAFELPERAAHERAVDGLRAAAGDAVFADAWTAGHALTLDEAVAEATRLHPPDAATARRRAPELASGGLSPRELDVLKRLVAGASNREIAEALFISPRTVQGHLASIFAKLGVGSRSAAVARAFERKLV